ncbi:Mu-like prophage major head subunit gpT family protein [Agrobacterium salinitolerans]|uniref:Mu-like prophage major head subunit gpT family protein n=1 Tax=Agrobacterium salinitolerans TaxID=1183413 RepID=UPI0022B83458|nr:Mu-like prophage major head subunit gpT family protein [Agrobacterium salinitolerans]MCZ7886043.1 Mu-like prophage major head subunit gpT family protein [Agrobacterium salinitolerans]
MDIKTQTLRSAYVGFNAAFQQGIGEATSMFGRIATTVPSTTATQEYGWLGNFPGFREWIGDRVVNGLAKHGYSLKNKDYENTIGVDRNDFNDDNLGIYAPMFRDFGQTAVTFPDTLIWPLLKAGWATECYDKQFFFDTDHPVLDANGNPISVANTDGGNGTPWFLLDTSRALKPLIYQERKKFTNLVRMDKEDDENVFTKKEFRYGLDGRCAVGFGFWQMAWGSKQVLDTAHYEAARTGLANMKGDYGRPLAIQPKLLVVPPSLEGAARRIVGNSLKDGGGTNEWFGTAEVLVVPWLA